MAVAAPARPAAADLLGVFTPEVFAAHLASQAALPSWWLERKRSAYSRFESLPMPRRTDESWRFSNIAGINLGGFSPAADAPAPGNRRAPEALAIAPAATLSFLNGRLSASTPLPADLAARGVVASAISGAIARHPGLLRKLHRIDSEGKRNSDGEQGHAGNHLGHSRCNYLRHGTERNTIGCELHSSWKLFLFSCS